MRNSDSVCYIDTLRKVSIRITHLFVIGDRLFDNKLNPINQFEGSFREPRYGAIKRQD